MLHACFTPIALYFIYTSWHFYAFSGTNLLTRCLLFSAVFLFQVLLKEIFSELDETKAEVPIYLTRRRSPKGETETSQEPATLGDGAAQPLAAPPHGVGPLGAL
jgi:hypothetical protein